MAEQVTSDRVEDEPGCGGSVFYELYLCGSFVCRTDPLDVARVEGRTFVVTEDKYESVPHVKEGVKGILGNWMSPEQMKEEMQQRTPGCMKGNCQSKYIQSFSSWAFSKWLNSLHR